MSTSSKISYYCDGVLREETWFKGGVPHREDGPQLICYSEFGIIEFIAWVQHNRSHRTDGPAVRAFKENFFTHSKERYLCFECWDQHGKPYREDGGPHMITYDIYNGKIADMSWYNDFGLSRQNGPAEITYYLGNLSCERYLVDGLYFRADGGPTIIEYHPDGSVHKEMWTEQASLSSTNFRRNILHREDGPAQIEYEPLS